MSYSQEQLEQALALHSRLVQAGLDPDYAELRVLRSLDGIENASVDEVAGEIVGKAPDRWKAGSEEPDPSTSFFDELRRRIEAERAAQRKPGPSAAERLSRGTR
jgi:hypothetical protein